METSGLPESLRARMEELAARPSMQVVRDFLLSHVLDMDGPDEIRADLRSVASFGTYWLRQDLAALESVVADPPMDDTLARLVGWEANWVLDDPSDAGAVEFLRELAQMLREVIDEAE